APGPPCRPASPRAVCRASRPRSTSGWESRSSTKWSRTGGCRSRSGSTDGRYGTASKSTPPSVRWNRTMFRPSQIPGKDFEEMKTHMRDGSGTRHYKYAFESMDRYANVRIYYQKRKGDPRIRLHERPGTPEFEREYQRAFSGEMSDRVVRPADRKAAPDTFRWVCEHNYASAAFLAWAAKTTRPKRRRILDEICQQPHRETGQLAGTLPYRLITPREIAAIRDAKAETPEAANMR